jgi:riboflavin synthase
MFTGIVEGTGLVVEKKPTEAAIRMVLEVGLLAQDAEMGASVAVNGCCLTVVNIAGSRLSFDMLHETEQRTSLGAAGPGLKVNLERSLRADARLGGHFVTGHVDGTGLVRRWEQVGKDYILEITIPQGYVQYVVPKGCIAIDGMSLTVVDVGPDWFSVWIIPHTREITNLSERKTGDRVNLEFDLIAKYTEKILAVRGGL